MIVCSPRNGGKAMKTPIEKASAVRSGGSSIASRRRNVLRNIRSAFIREDPWRPPYLPKTLQRFCLVFVSVEDGQQFGNHQQVLNSIGKFEQLELTTLATDGGVVGDQLADAARVDVADAREIQQHFLFAAVDELSNGVAQGDTAFADTHFAAQVENGNVAGLSFFPIEFRHGVSPFEVSRSK